MQRGSVWTPSPAGGEHPGVAQQVPLAAPAPAATEHTLGKALGSAFVAAARSQRSRDVGQKGSGGGCDAGESGWGQGHPPMLPHALGQTHPEQVGTSSPLASLGLGDAGQGVCVLGAWHHQAVMKWPGGAEQSQNYSLWGSEGAGSACQGKCRGDAGSMVPSGLFPG